MSRPIRIREVEPSEGFKVRLKFTDNTMKEIDLTPYLHGPIFEPIRNDPHVFRSVKVDSRMGTIVWENGADIDPDVLFLGLLPAWIESAEEVGFDYRLENDPKFLQRIENARKSLQSGKGIKLEDS